MSVRLLVCGDRHWTDGESIFTVIRALHARHQVECVIEGECRGADILGRQAADRLKIPVLRYPANWKLYGAAAGPIRNQRMLDLARPTLAAVFHSNLAASRGTADMVERLKKAAIPYVVFES